jgi:hypothetical protein
MKLVELGSEAIARAVDGYVDALLLTHEDGTAALVLDEIDAQRLGVDPVVEASEKWRAEMKRTLAMGAQVPTSAIDAEGA